MSKDWEYTRRKEWWSRDGEEIWTRSKQKKRVERERSTHWDQKRINEFIRMIKELEKPPMAVKEADEILNGSG